ncbi:MAG TPA: transcription termination/antitermination protein NusG [Planctomycetota bacterium]|nr:transcription termination/antitermination protein NusG [Planctomycetota bacterium]
MAKAWYAIRAQSEREDLIRDNLEAKVKAAGIESLISRIMVPREHVSEIRDGKKRIIQRKMYPGYILVEADLTDEAWFLITETPGISGFVGSRTKPVPLTEGEIGRILRDIEDKKERPRPKVEFEVGDGVKIRSGPFENYDGVIEEINPTKGVLRVSVSIFGRSTPVELEYSQVERL